MAVLVPGTAVYARYVEPRWLRRVSVDVPLPGLAARLRAVHLSDFHASDQVPFSLIERAITMALEAEPDVVFITGDFITRAVPEPKRYAELLRRLSDRVPVLACLGNHDGGKWARGHAGYADTRPVLRLLDAAGIDCLRDESRAFEAGRARLAVVGLKDWWADRVDLASAFPDQASGDRTPIVLLSHNPDSKDMVRDHAWDLMLCGHTHGGQIALPIVGTPFAPVEDHRYVRGLNPWQGRLIHTSGGVGNVLGVRLNCRPEVNILNLVPGR